VEADLNELWRGWWHDAGRPEVDAALSALFVRIDADVAAGNPVCEISGRCCRFDAYGHRLYVTCLEIAWLMRHLNTAARDRLAAAPLPAMSGCPFQVGRLCCVRDIRPLGCRLFFCDPAAEVWLNDLHEHYLGDLRRLHELRSINYRYIEWRSGLAEARTALAPSLLEHPPADVTIQRRPERDDETEPVG